MLNYAFLLAAVNRRQEPICELGYCRGASVVDHSESARHQGALHLWAPTPGWQSLQCTKNQGRDNFLGAQAMLVTSRSREGEEGLVHHLLRGHVVTGSSTSEGTSCRHKTEMSRRGACSRAGRPAAGGNRGSAPS